MDIFGIKRRREERLKAKEERIRFEQEKKSAQIKAQKEAYQARKKMITDWLKSYDNRKYDEERKKYHELKANADKHNSKCPRCGSTEVINKITRLQGEINGHSEYNHQSDHFAFLLASDSSSSFKHNSDMHGEMDTNPVNRCKSCGHEWKIEEVKWPSIDNIYEHYSSSCPIRMIWAINSYYNLSFDPHDIKEEYNSLQEKRENYIKNEIRGDWDERSRYKEAPRYMMEYALYQGLDDEYPSYGYSKVPKWYGNFNSNMDKYSYQMPDELWELIKKILHRQD